MRALFCGVTCALDADGTLVLDPTAKQEKVGVKARVAKGRGRPWPSPVGHTFPPQLARTTPVPADGLCSVLFVRAGAGNPTPNA